MHFEALGTLVLLRSVLTTEALTVLLLEALDFFFAGPVLAGLLLQLLLVQLPLIIMEPHLQNSDM
jgi:hypothetical protein